MKGSGNVSTVHLQLTGTSRFRGDLAQIWQVVFSLTSTRITHTIASEPAVKIVKFCVQKSFCRFWLRFSVIKSLLPGRWLVALGKQRCQTSMCGVRDFVNMQHASHKSFCFVSKHSSGFLLRCDSRCFPRYPCPPTTKGTQTRENKRNARSPGATVPDWSNIWRELWRFGLEWCMGWPAGGFRGAFQPQVVRCIVQSDKSSWHQYKDLSVQTKTGNDGIFSGARNKLVEWQQKLLQLKQQGASVAAVVFLPWYKIAEIDLSDYFCTAAERRKSQLCGFIYSALGFHVVLLLPRWRDYCLHWFIRGGAAASILHQKFAHSNTFVQLKPFHSFSRQWRVLCPFQQQQPTEIRALVWTQIN